jgi:hypothetical protein
MVIDYNSVSRKYLQNYFLKERKMRYWQKVEKRIQKKLINGQYIGGESVWARDIAHLIVSKGFSDNIIKKYSTHKYLTECTPFMDDTNAEYICCQEHDIICELYIMEIPYLSEYSLGRTYQEGWMNDLAIRLLLKNRLKKSVYIWE